MNGFSQCYIDSTVPHDDISTLTNILDALSESFYFFKQEQCDLNGKSFASDAVPFLTAYWLDIGLAKDGIGWFNNIWPTISSFFKRFIAYTIISESLSPLGFRIMFIGWLRYNVLHLFLSIVVLFLQLNLITSVRMSL